MHAGILNNYVQGFHNSSAALDYLISTSANPSIDLLCGLKMVMQLPQSNLIRIMETSFRDLQR